MTKFTYKNHRYELYVDVEDDNRKRFHIVNTADGKYSRHLPLSPYESCSEQYFQKWVDAGCPTAHRLSERELDDMIFTMITEEELANTN